jgi:hypothetical protein
LELAAHLRERQFQALAEAYASAVLVSRFEVVAACGCGCVKIYAVIKAAQKEEKWA